MIDRILKPVFDFFLPRICEHCGKKLTASENIFCGECFSSLQPARTERISHEYNRKFANERIIDDFQSAFIFVEETPIQSAIHSLKYNGKFKVGIYLGETAGKLIAEPVKNWEADFLLPVPLFHAKKAERGYNQSFYIAKGFSKILKLPVNSRIIKRTRYTQTQTALNFEERKENMLNAFETKHRKKIKGSKIILVDDVITTGSTVRECGRVLKLHGAEKVFALSVAIAE